MAAGTRLGWPPRDIFKATLPEFLLALDGWRRANGFKPVPRPMSRDRLNELHERYGQ